MQYSKNYSLNKPQPADQFNIEHWNENTDSLDSLLKTLEVRLTEQINNFLSHQQNTSNPHSVTKAQVGLGNCNNTADANKVVASAAKLTTARKVYVKLGTASTTETKDFSGDTAIPVSGTLSVANGGTGQTSLANVSVGYASNASTASNAVRVDGYRVSTESGTIKNDSLNALVPVEKQYFGTSSGYIKYKNGLLIQWGYYKAKGESYTLYFPIAFSSKAYTILGMQDKSRGGSGSGYMSVAEKETSYAILKNDPWENNWLAVGY